MGVNEFIEFLSDPGLHNKITQMGQLQIYGIFRGSYRQTDQRLGLEHQRNLRVGLSEQTTLTKQVVEQNGRRHSCIQRFSFTLTGNGNWMRYQFLCRFANPM